jgi:glucose-1-phosphate adenylyltransferase
MPRQGIGAGTTIRGAILDKNCHVGERVSITNPRGLETTENTPDDTEQAVIRDGIVCIPRGAIVPNGSVI